MSTLSSRPSSPTPHVSPSVWSEVWWPPRPHAGPGYDSSLPICEALVSPAPRAPPPEFQHKDPVCANGVARDRGHGAGHQGRRGRAARQPPREHVRPARDHPHVMSRSSVQ